MPMIQSRPHLDNKGSAYAVRMHRLSKAFAGAIVNQQILLKSYTPAGQILIKQGKG